VILEQKGRLPEAVAAYQDVVRLTPDDAAAWFRLGALQERLVEFAAARTSLEQASRLDYSDAAIHKSLGVVYDRLGDIEKAELAFRKALELDPDDVTTLVNLGVILISKKQQGLAVGVLKEAVSHDPKNS